MDFEIYREELESMSRSGTEKGGRPPYDAVLMFKIVILQKLYNLSDHQQSIRSTIVIRFKDFLELVKTRNYRMRRRSGYFEKD
ncbi:transposase PF05598 domain protein [Leptospira interrogans serovar Bataviae str. HAI135]|nr:transposase PF05598 domain protein [Leptospira interrogans serovar Bataviae str. HAI135]